MTEGFPKMRYEVIEDDQPICLTDCDVSASVTFAKACQKITESEGQTIVEFRDHKEKKFVRVTYETGEME